LPWYLSVSDKRDTIDIMDGDFDAVGWELRKEKIATDMVKLKSLFYALRTAMAGKWILECGTMPPVRFREMLPLVTKEVTDEIEDLMRIKSENAERYMHKRPENVCNFISEVIATNDQYAKTLTGGKPDTERINRFLYKCITES